jgi:uncharacterized membrane protein HdeD (DUF308 family)
MAFAKEKRINNIMILAGLIAAASGLVIWFAANKTAGVIVFIVGLSLLLIGWTISGVFYRIKMMELMENRKKTNEK